MMAAGHGGRTRPGSLAAAPTWAAWGRSDIAGEDPARGAAAFFGDYSRKGGLVVFERSKGAVPLVRLVCEVCGRAGPWRPTATLAVADGLRRGWEVVHSYHGCPACTETGRAACLEAAQEAVYAVTEDDGEVD